MQTAIVLIPVLPFLAFLLNGLFGRALGRAGGWIAVLCMGGSAAISLCIFFSALGGGLAQPIDVHLWDWISSGTLDVRVGFHVDQLTALMLSFVTFVSTLVFLYSMGYMEGEPGFNRFFAYLGLFDFSMLILVLADSLPLLFVGWEGVGLCSYLLIGYYLDMPGAANAGKKAFIVNRIGDFGFLVAMFIIFKEMGTLNIHDVVTNAPNTASLHAGGGLITALTLMLFLGCTGKSAQIPLFIWLPDAMAGPTPVSALIHAATMVTAGVYLMVRLSVLFALAPTTMIVVACVAAATAFVAGTIALTQNDIKKVLAYSTVSQLGYMFLACGVGAFTAGIFHVFTHAFFKAALFLGAGSVIHAAHHQQDLRMLGGLRKKMTVTALTFLVACVAIAGVPPLAGFFSKDEILTRTFTWHGPGALPGLLYTVGMITALMTAIYSFRAYFLAFEGTSRLDEHTRHDLHESPATMTIPLIVLAVGAAFAGFLKWPVDRLLEPIVGPAQEIIAKRAAGATEAAGTGLEIGLMALSVIVALCGIYLAYSYCLKRWPDAAARLAQRLGFLYQLSYHRWWWDDFYNVFFAGGLKVIAFIATAFDRWIIDGVLWLVAGITSLASRTIRMLQSGQVQAYALAILIGVNLILWIVFRL